MRTLILNKFLHRNGGSETYIFKLGEALEQHGHEVQYFGMEHEGRCVGNRVNAYKKYAVDLLLFKQEGLFLTQIPKEVRLLPLTSSLRYMKKYIFDMSLGWIIKVYLANLVAGVLAMCLFGNIVNAHITGFISFFIWAAVVFAGVCLIDVVLNYFFFKNETKTVLYKIGKKFAR